MKATVAALSLALATPAGAHVAKPDFYFIGGDEVGRWCAYPSAAGLRHAEERINAAERYVDYEQGGVFLDRSHGIAALEVSAGPESGDWIMTDHYDLVGSKPSAVRRSVNYADGSSELVETFQLRGGKLVRTSSLGGGYRPIERPYADLSRAPFYAFLIKAAKARQLPSRGYCISAASPRQGPR